MKSFVIFTEILGVILLSTELGIMLRSPDTDFHILGYVGAILLVAGGLCWSKLKNDQ